ncbi:MAG: SprT family zinc-dependent metalloprotease [Verrucomicrobiota bacterium]
MKIRAPLAVNIGERCVPVEIRRRKGTRHLRLMLGHQNQIIASVPWRCSDKEAMAFIEVQRPWVEAQLASVPAAGSLTGWLSKHPRVSASGDVFHLRIVPSAGRRADYSFAKDGADLVLRLPDPEEDSAVLKLVRRFAKDALYCRTAFQAKRLALEVPAVSVRDQSSRWGSCSSKRALSLNWRLVLLEPELQDYVILHELAHLTEMNHSKRFWALLDDYDPQRAEHEAQLDAIAATIMRVGR